MAGTILAVLVEDKIVAVENIDSWESV